MGISRHSIEEVKRRAPIVDVVSAHVTLKRRGKSFVGLSPFSNEKNPSFYVHPDGNYYYCFSTSQGGDVIRFIREVENLPFTEAVESLANRFNIELQYEEGGPTREERSLRKQLIEIHEHACEFYHDCFRENSEPGRAMREYWTQQRGFPEDLAREYKIGYAPQSGSALQERLAGKQFSMDALCKCGLFYARGDEHSPRALRSRFRGRLMIPIRDTQGQVVAFTARQTDYTPSDDPAAQAKYINSPETDLFHKSELLFNLDRARSAVGDDAPFILVEGQLDAIRCWSVGLGSAIAFQGSAITEAQIRLLKRYHNRLLCLFDGDAAGAKAGMAAIPLALQAGMGVEIIALPTGIDPDTLLRNRGADGFFQLKSRRKTAARFLMECLLPHPSPSPQEKQEAFWKLFPILQNCESAIVRDSMLEEAIALADAPRAAVREDFQRFLKRGAPMARNRPIPTPDAEKSRPQGLTTAESHLLFFFLHHEWSVDEVAKVIDIEWINHSTTEGELLGRIMAERQEGNWDGIECIETVLESDEERNCVYAILAHELPFENPVQEINKCLERIFRNYIARRLGEVDERLRRLPADAQDRRALRVERAALNRQRLATKPPQLLRETVP